MSIAFARMQTVTRSAGRSMRDKIDYIARRGRYAAKGGLIAGPVTVLPAGAPAIYRDERRLWSDAEAVERYGYIIAQEIVVALPQTGEMPAAHARKFCYSLAETFSQEYGVAVTFALHADAIEAEHLDAGLVQPARDLESSNNHAHFLLGSRQLSEAGFSPRRHRALLPEIGGRTVSRSAADARLHTVGATSFCTLVGSAIERYCDRTGLPVRLRLPAIHTGYHVGPIASVRALFNDVEALVRRPDADAIFRKLDRLQVNSEVERRNIDAVAAIEPLVQHLGDRVFTPADVEALVHRYCENATTARHIIEEVMRRSLVFVTTPTGQQFHVMPAFRALEQRIADLARQLRSSGPDLHVSIKSLKELAADDATRRRLMLLDIANAGSADALERLSAALVAEGRTVVLSTHLNKRREPPRDVLQRALHWSGDFTLPEGCTVLVDEADLLTLPLLEKLLGATLAANANIVFCRRTYRKDMIANPTLSAIVSGNHLVLGGGDRAPTDLPFDLTLGRTVQFVGDTDAALQLAAELVSRMPSGRKAFFLCADPAMIAWLEEYGRREKRELLAGPLVPPEWEGMVVVLYSPLVSARHLRSIADLELRFVVPRTLASAAEQLMRQLRLHLGRLTTLTDPVRPASLEANSLGIATGGNERSQATANVDVPSTPDRHSDASADRELAGYGLDEIGNWEDDPDPNEANGGWDDEDDDADPESAFHSQPDDVPDDDPG